MNNEKTKSQKGIHVGLVALLVVYFLIDSVLMFFIQPSVKYVFISAPILAIVTFLSLKMKPELMTKEMPRIRGILLIIASMVINTAVDIIRVFVFKM